MIRTAAILLLLAATAADAQLTTTVKRIRLEHATAAELAGTTLDLGHAVVNEENLADLRIGDGATPGGVRVGSDWWTNNMLSAWGGLSRVDVEALVALSIPHVDLTPYAFSADLLDYARLSDYAAATNAIWGSLATKAAASNLVSEAGRLDGRINTLTSTATSEVARLDGRVDSLTTTATSEVARLDGRVDSLTSTTTGEVGRLDGRVDNITAASLGALTAETDPVFAAAETNLALLRDVETLLAFSIGRIDLSPYALAASLLDYVLLDNYSSTTNALWVSLATKAAASNLVAEAGRLDGRIDGITAASLGALTAETDPVASSNLLVLAASHSNLYITVTGEVDRLDGRIENLTAGDVGGISTESDPIASSNLSAHAAATNAHGLDSVWGAIDGKTDPAWVESYVASNAPELADYALATNAVTPADLAASESNQTAALLAVSNAIPTIEAEADPIASSNLAAHVAATNAHGLDAVWGAIDGKVDSDWVSTYVSNNAPELADYALATNAVTLADLAASESNQTAALLGVSNAIPSLTGYATWLAGAEAFTGQAGSNGTPTMSFASGGAIFGFTSISGTVVRAGTLEVSGRDPVLDNPSTAIDNTTAELLNPLDIEMGELATYTIDFGEAPASFATGAGVSRLDLVTTNTQAYSAWMLVATATNTDDEVVSASVLPFGLSCTNTIYFDLPVRLPVEISTAAAIPVPGATSAVPRIVDLTAWAGVPGRTYDLSGHTVLVPDGALPRQAVNYSQLDAIATTLSNRITAITPAENGVKLNGNAVEFGNRWTISEEEGTNDMDLVIRCQGDEVFRFAGGTLALPNLQNIYVDASGLLRMIVLGNTNLTYGVEYTTDIATTNDWATWTNGVTAESMGSGLMAVTITNTLSNVFFRVTAESDGGAGPIQIVSSVPILGTTIGSGSADFTPVWEAFTALSNEVAAITNLTLDPTNFTVNLEGYVTTGQLASTSAALDFKIDTLSNSVPDTAANVFSFWSTGLLSRITALESFIATNGNVTNDVFSPNPAFPGAIRCVFSPSHTYLSGARWSLDYGVTMRTNGAVVTNLAQGTYPLLITNGEWRFKSPTTATVNAYGALTNTVTLTFAPQGKVSFGGPGSITWGGGEYVCAAGQMVTSPVGPQTFIYSDETAYVTPDPLAANVIFGETLAVPSTRTSWGRVSFVMTNYDYSDWPGAPYDRNPVVKDSGGNTVTAQWGTVNHDFNASYNGYWPKVSIGGAPITYCYLPAGTHTFHFASAAGYLPPSPWTVAITNGQTANKTAVWSAGSWLRVTSNVSGVSFDIGGTPYSLSKYSTLFGPFSNHASYVITPASAGASYITPEPFSHSTGTGGSTTTVGIAYSTIEGSAKAAISIEPSAAAAVVTNFQCRGLNYPANTPVALGVGTSVVSVANQYLYSPSFWFWYGASSSVVCSASSTSAVTLTMTKAAKLQFVNDSGYSASYAVDGGAWKTDAQYLYPGEYEITFSTTKPDWFHTPPATNITVTNGQSLTVRPVWEKKPAALTVNLDSAAASNGAMWSIDAGANWNLSGATVSNLTWGEPQTVTFSDCLNTNYYVTPKDKNVAMWGWNITNNVEYSQMGYLSITHTAPTLIPDMVRCTRDGGVTWLTNDVTLHLPAGSYTFIPHYESSNTYASPGSQSVTVIGAQTNSLEFTWRGYGWLKLTCASPQGRWDNTLYGTARTLPEGIHTAAYTHTTAGWFAPTTNGFLVSPWSTNSYAVSYTQAGQLSVTANPSPNGNIDVAGEWCATYGPRYSLNGGPWRSMDYGLGYGGYYNAYRYILPGTYTATFSTVYGWAKPDDIVVHVEAGAMEAITGQYTQ